MDTITCLIVDDEPMALALMEKYVNNTTFLTLVKKCSNGFEVLDYLNSNQVDLIFMDIQMPELTGLELSKVVPKTSKVVFTTAFNQYALEGFKVDALDYLLKPFNYTEFLQSAYKAREWFKLVRNVSGNEKQIVHAEAEPNKKYLFVKSEYKQIKIEIEDIIYIEGLKDYAKIWLKDHTKPILTLMSLKKLEEELPKSKFMRIHRSFIVGLDKIEAIERSQVLIQNQRITVSDQYKEEFSKFLNDNSIDR